MENGAAVKFKEAMADSGYILPGDPVSDGNLHRFPHEDRNGGKAGWYILHADGIPASSYGDWRSGRKFKWCAKGESELTPAEREDYWRRIEQQKAIRRQAKKQAQAEAAKSACQEWDLAQPANPDHPYLKKKGVKVYGIRQDTNGRLLIPVRDPEGNLTSLQTINNDGTKRFLTGGRKQGCFHSINGKDPELVYVCEGYATGVTIHEATGANVVLAFDSGNLPPVAAALREKHPTARIIIAADDDQHRPDNPGMKKAREAVDQSKCELISPKFKDMTGNPSDFNDLFLLEGADAVREQIRTAARDPLFPPWQELVPPDEETWRSYELNPRCIVENYLYADLGQIYGMGSAGKTTLVLWEMIHIRLGLPLYGLEIKTPGPCLYVTAEDCGEYLKARLWRLVSAMGLNRAQRDAVKTGVIIVDLSDKGPAARMLRIQEGAVMQTDVPHRLIKAYKDLKPVLIALDPTISFGVDEGRVNENMQGLVVAGRTIIRALDCCVRYIHHCGQTSAREQHDDLYGGRSGTAMPDGCRMITALNPYNANTQPKHAKPPPEMQPDNFSSLIRLNRPKVSYCLPNLPTIWIKRTGWDYEHFTEVYKTGDTRGEDSLRLDELCQMILDHVKAEEAAGHFPSKTSIEAHGRSQIGVSQAATRQALATLLSRNGLVEKEKPKKQRGYGFYIGIPEPEPEAEAAPEEEEAGPENASALHVEPANEESGAPGVKMDSGLLVDYYSLLIGKRPAMRNRWTIPIVPGDSSLTSLTRNHEENEESNREDPKIIFGEIPEPLTTPDDGSDGVEVPEAKPPDIPPGGGEWEVEM